MDLETEASHHVTINTPLTLAVVSETTGRLIEDLFKHTCDQHSCLFHPVYIPTILFLNVIRSFQLSSRQCSHIHIPRHSNWSNSLIHSVLGAYHSEEEPYHKSRSSQALSTYGTSTPVRSSSWTLALLLSDDWCSTIGYGCLDSPHSSSQI